MFGFGLGTILSMVDLGVRVAELAGGSGPEKKKEALKQITENPLMTVSGQPELERLIEDELLPVIVKLAHLVGSFERISDEVQL